jgi:6-phospho-beta-glucosidase
MKIAVVGGGSTYTPELIDGVAGLESTLSIDDISLIDPDLDRLEIIGPFAARILAAHDHPGRLTWTVDLDAGLDGADAVIVQLRVGGQQARITDETIPLRFGRVGQETTGAGGLAKALRTVPVVVDVAGRAARRAAPGAWIIDFTNPVGIVTRALLDAGHRAIGLCNSALGVQRAVAGMLAVAPAAVRLDHTGLNHLTWVRAAWVDGTDRLPDLLGDHLDDLAALVGLPATVLARLGCVPSYYLRYFYDHDGVVARDRGTPTRGQRVAEIESELLRLYADPTLDRQPDLLASRGGAHYSAAAIGLMESLYGGVAAPHAVNVRNAGTLPFLGPEAVIEVVCDVDRAGAVPRPVAPFAPELAGLVAHVSAYEELAVEAALRGGRDRVYRALLAHPLIGQHRLADDLADALVAANAEHLAWA